MLIKAFALIVVLGLLREAAQYLESLPEKDATEEKETAINTFEPVI